MKKFFLAASLLASFAVYAENPKFQNLSDKDIEEVGNEFAMNFSHTAVAAPETDGIWGFEVGLLAGRTGSPRLKKVVDDAGRNGSDFKNIYHAGLMARAHFPYEIFLEATVLPQRELSDVEVQARSFGLGWNLGTFFQMPLDLAIGANVSSSEIDFNQTTTVITPGDTTSNINIDSKTRVLWVGLSKSFLFFTPFAKIGTARSESDVKSSVANSTVFSDRSSKKHVESDGGYWALGAEFELLIFKIGVETSAQADVKRTSAKFSLDF